MTTGRAQELAGGEREHARLLQESGVLELALVSREEGEPQARLSRLWDQMRVATSRERTRALGASQGFRLEDATAVSLGVPRGGHGDTLLGWLRRRLSPRTELSVALREGPLTLAAVFAPRVGFAPDRARYARDASGRVQVEAFELHVVEHCNLRCANCCNMSPLVGAHVLSVEEVVAQCAQLSTALHADVLKVMGGEPLLHPDVAGVVWALRRSGLGDRVRLFTNGLRLPAMGDAFWESLEDLTISSYRSAPVKPAVLELARERSLRHGFVLNVKDVGEFSQVLSPRYEPDDARTQQTFSRCWLRHRCLILRRGRFYMCTRAAYADDFLAKVAHEPPSKPLDRSQDGVRVGGPELPARLEAYLNRAEPLGACRYCFGGDGGVEPHYQLTKDEVARGVLSRALAPQEAK